MVKFACKVSSVYYKNLHCVYDMEPNTLIYALNGFIVIYCKIILIIDTIFIIINIFSIIKFQGLVARQPYLCKIYSLFSVLLGYVRLLGTLIDSSFDIEINIKIVKIAVCGDKCLQSLVACVHRHSASHRWYRHSMLPPELPLLPILSISLSKKD